MIQTLRKAPKTNKTSIAAISFSLKCCGRQKYHRLPPKCSFTNRRRRSQTIRLVTGSKVRTAKAGAFALSRAAAAAAGLRRCPGKCSGDPGESVTSLHTSGMTKWKGKAATFKGNRFIPPQRGETGLSYTKAH